MNSETAIKISIGVVAAGVWITAVFLHKAPIAPLINACQLALTGLGIYHFKN